jgi:hypothetical protein
MQPSEDMSDIVVTIGNSANGAPDKSLSMNLYRLRLISTGNSTPSLLRADNSRPTAIFLYTGIDIIGATQFAMDASSPFPY